MNLTKVQEEALEDVEAADLAFRQVKANATRQAKIFIADLIARHQLQVDNMVRTAVELGVPKRQIGLQGLHTSNPNAAANSLARTESLAFAGRAE